MSSSKTSGLTENRLLATLPRDEYERLLPNLESVRSPKNRILHEAGNTIHHAYFLSSGMASLLGKQRNRISTEAVELERRGLINCNRRGQMKILDSQKTTATACECYRITRDGIENSLDL